MKKLASYFTKAEVILWVVSVLGIIVSFLVFDKENYMTLIASLIGVTSLIFNAKANPVGQMMMIIFSILYGIISYRVAYYGEMITYIGMTLPMAAFALVSWLRNPFGNNFSEVEINIISKKEWIFMFFLSLIVTAGFYFILKFLSTSNLIPSTLSVTTSFIAAYLTFRRNPCYAIAYAANDLVLFVLWIWASFSCLSYISVVVCFIVFFANDIYGFINWKRIYKRQQNL